jgi:transketolase
MQNITDIAKEVRRTVIEMAHRSKSAHVGSALSCVDIMTVLYWEIMKLEPWQDRDIFILSKAHAAMSLYSTLAIKGVINKNMLDGYFQNNGTLPAHLDRFTAKGIEVSAGSLGHGFNIGLGMAYGFKKRKNNKKVYTIIGDGESQEGSIWEGAFFASKLGIDNFTAIIDYNNLQGYGRPCEICSYEPITDKWKAFGWHAIEVDGHDMESLVSAFKESSNGKPKVIIAHTIKGKGVSFMENQLIWHYYIVTEEHREKALQELA